jgi:hypothetical protein
VIVVAPSPIAVARPVELIVAAAGADDVHAAVVVRI